MNWNRFLLRHGFKLALLLLGLQTVVIFLDIVSELWFLDELIGMVVVFVLTFITRVLRRIALGKEKT